jgi:hypothetical protein
VNEPGDPLEAVRLTVGSGGEADDVLRAVVALVVDRGAARWAGILFVEGDELVLGPEAGVADPGARSQVPVVYRGTRVAQLAADGCDDADLLARIAPLVAEHCLVGWDTGGVPWDEARTE